MVHPLGHGARRIGGILPADPGAPKPLDCGCAEAWTKAALGAMGFVTRS